jgi:hypothetical protein
MAFSESRRKRACSVRVQPTASVTAGARGCTSGVDVRERGRARVRGRDWRRAAAEFPAVAGSGSSRPGRARARGGRASRAAGRTGHAGSCWARSRASGSWPAARRRSCWPARCRRCPERSSSSCARQAWKKRKTHGGMSQKRLLGPSRDRILPGNGWPPPGSESCVVSGATPAAKRRQRVRGPCDPASKGISFARADAVKNAEGCTEAPQWPGAEVSPGSKSRARVLRVLQEPGRSRRLHSSRIRARGTR